MSDTLPRVVIVGGGFAGLAAAKALRKTPARIILIDRSNHHLFQPLLYQVGKSARRFEAFSASSPTPP
jgi:NADH dehydrogenase